MTKLIQKLRAQFQRHRGTITAALVGVFLFAGYHVAHAGIVTDIEHMVAAIIGDLTIMVTFLIGALISFVMFFVIDIASYDGFADAPAVIKGWVLMRDLANMGIVIGLLIVAFGSAFSEKYQLSKSLSTLVITAIVINFSKTITLFLIDISQVIMLSFVNSFRNIGAGNIISILGIEKFFDVNSNPDLGITTALAALYFTVFTMIMVLGTLVVLAITLMTRVIALWFLIVLSPIAFAMYAIPVSKLQGIKDKWWEEISNWLIIGPMLAFFIWLTFVSLGNANDLKTSSLIPTDQDTLDSRKASTTNTSSLGKLGDYDQLAGFVIAIGMLLGGLKYSSEVAGSAGAMAGSLGKKGQAMGMAPFKKAYAFAESGVKAVAGGFAKGVSKSLYEGKVPILGTKVAPTLGKYLTTRGWQEASQKTAARVEKFSAGGASELAVEKVAEEQAKGRVEDLKNQGMHQDVAKLESFIENAIKNNNAKDARAGFELMAQQGWENEKLWDGAMNGYDRSGKALETGDQGILGKSFSSDVGRYEFKKSIQDLDDKNGITSDKLNEVKDKRGVVVADTQKSRSERKSERVRRAKGEAVQEILERDNTLGDESTSKKEKIMRAAAIGAVANDEQVGKMEGTRRAALQEQLESLMLDPEALSMMKPDQKLEISTLLEKLSAERQGTERMISSEPAYERWSQSDVKRRDQLEDTIKGKEKELAVVPVNDVAKRTKLQNEIDAATKEFKKIPDNIQNIVGDIKTVAKIDPTSGATVMTPVIDANRQKSQVTAKGKTMNQVVNFDSTYTDPITKAVGVPDTADTVAYDRYVRAREKAEQEAKGNKGFYKTDGANVNAPEPTSDQQVAASAGLSSTIVSRNMDRLSSGLKKTGETFKKSAKKINDTFEDLNNKNFSQVFGLKRQLRDSFILLGDRIIGDGRGGVKGAKTEVRDRDMEIRALVDADDVSTKLGDAVEKHFASVSKVYGKQWDEESDLRDPKFAGVTTTFPSVAAAGGNVTVGNLIVKVKEEVESSINDARNARDVVAKAGTAATPKMVADAEKAQKVMRQKVNAYLQTFSPERNQDRRDQLGDSMISGEIMGRFKKHLKDLGKAKNSTDRGAAEAQMKKTLQTIDEFLTKMRREGANADMVADAREKYKTLAKKFKGGEKTRNRASNENIADLEKYLQSLQSAIEEREFTAREYEGARGKTKLRGI